MRAAAKRYLPHLIWPPGFQKSPFQKLVRSWEEVAKIPRDNPLYPYKTKVFSQLRACPKGPLTPMELERSWSAIYCKKPWRANLVASVRRMYTRISSSFVMGATLHTIPTVLNSLVSQTFIGIALNAQIRFVETAQGTLQKIYNY